MRAVLDTNVVVSAVLIRVGNERHILDAWRHGAFDLVLSPQLLEELGRVLSYPRIRDTRWMTEAEVVELLQILAEESIFVPGQLMVTASRDPTDDKFIVAALEADADYLVTGDKDLLTLGAYRDVKIVTPGAFRGILGAR
jgi:putative PIN family toxin of toxin-antitoxin system